MTFHAGDRDGLAVSMVARAADVCADLSGMNENAEEVGKHNPASTAYEYFCRCEC